MDPTIEALSCLVLDLGLYLDLVYLGKVGTY